MGNGNGRGHGGGGGGGGGKGGGKGNGDDRDNKLNGDDGDNTISGGGGNDRLAGHAGKDTLKGDDGNDNIGGGKGHDVLTGGSGRDNFVFNSFSSEDSDRITDFKSKTDKLQFDHSIFDLKIGKLSTDIFVAGKNAIDADDRFIYDNKSGKLYYDDDGNGAHAKQLVATLDHKAALVASDFIIS